MTSRYESSYLNIDLRRERKPDATPGILSSFWAYLARIVHNSQQSNTRGSSDTLSSPCTYSAGRLCYCRYSKESPHYTRNSPHKSKEIT